MILPRRPKFRREAVPLDRLTFDSRLQLRYFPDADGKPVTFDEAWVQQLLESWGVGDALPPLEAVEETQGKKTILWVFAGFHRGEMYRRAGVNSVEVLIYPGTFRDAEFYALAENGTTPLPRTPESCQKSFDRLMDTASLLGRVLDSVKEKGSSIERAIAAACGISASTVHKYLDRRGLRSDGRKLVEIPKPAVVSELSPEPARASGNPDDEDEDASEAVGRPAGAVGDTQLVGARLTLGEIQRDLRSIGRGVESLLNSKFGDYLREVARQKKLSFATKHQSRHEDINDTRTVEIEHWPVLGDLSAVFSDLAAMVHQSQVA